MAVIYKKEKDKAKITLKTLKPGVSVITPTNKLNNLDRILNNFLNQNFERKELIIVLNNNLLNLEYYKQKVKPYNNIKVFQLDEKYNLGECRDFAIKNANLEFIALFDDDDYYGPEYLKRTVNIFYEIDTDVVGKASFFTFFEGTKKLVLFHRLNNKNNENKYVSLVCDPTLVFKHSIMDKIKTYPGTQLNPDVLFQNLCKEYGFKIYSTDRYNFVHHRHPNLKDHTWPAEEKGILMRSEVIATNINDYRIYVDK